ncbi:MAG: hypothetical protein Metus_1091 [Candidatus Methanosuratincola subterraneus]|uniref:Uncharacterized protein n=1 Tax=Methanosuratincola subterraneus TaxID=2593994 RepID=A0A3S3VBX5_METS7|nr:MAG: hypothetical protein Metus_1091 [Candidatus Methanosuratincola subterraneus]
MDLQWLLDYLIREGAGYAEVRSQRNSGMEVAKIDCEGYESFIYEKDWGRHIRGRPTIIEAHNWRIVEGLSMYGFSVIEGSVYNRMLGVCYMKNF